LWQNGGDLGRIDASLRPEKTVADGNQNGRNRKPRGQACDQHHAPHPRKQRGLFGGRLARNGIGHSVLIFRSVLHRSGHPHELRKMSTSKLIESSTALSI